MDGLINVRYGNFTTFYPLFTLPPMPDLAIRSLIRNRGQHMSAKVNLVILTEHAYFVHDHVFRHWIFID